MAYAAETKVPIEQSRAEIERTLVRYGADRFGWFTEPGRASIVFEAQGRRLKFDLPLPSPRDKAAENESSRRTREQLTRARWRALLLCIKAKLEAVESKIETFEEAFLSHVVMPDGRTVAEHVVPAIERAYATDSMVPLLPPPTKK